MQGLIDRLMQVRHLRGAVAGALILALGGGVAMASATFGPVAGPFWLNPGYQWTVRVLTASNPDKQVCLDYGVTPPGTKTVINCTCDDSQYGDCTIGTGDWTCTIPTNFPNATIDWRLGTWSAGAGGTCGDEKTLAISGSLPTGPLAVDLSSFQAQTLGSGGGTAFMAGLVMALGLLRLRRGRAPV